MYKKTRQYCNKTKPALEHEGDVVVGHAVAEVGGAVFRALEHCVEGEPVPVEVSHVHGAGRVVVAHSPHFCKCNQKKQKESVLI